ncbi:hypothetical protein ACHQM5_010619 [Ranunculus cassubicifolius]
MTHDDSNTKAKNDLIAVPSYPSSKDETFFDSQGWLDSDCEDDYLSVNGDFTPRGSFSDQPSSNTGNLQLTKSESMDRPPNLNTEPSILSPTDKKMKLSELLVEGKDEQETPKKLDNSVKPSKSTRVISNLFPSLSRSNSLRSNSTPNSKSKQEEKEENSTKGAQCCLPMLLTSLSFRERKKKTCP